MGQQRKLTEMAAQLGLAARTDALTGLINRRAFFDEASAVIADNLPAPGALLFIDVDHFKSINDSFGHAIGDVVLREIAAVIRNTVPKDDLAARLGGEEFAVFLCKASLDTALSVADKIRVNVSERTKDIRILGHRMTVSIGLCMGEADLDLEDVLLRADRNLYAAKIRGRDTVVHDGPVPAFMRGEGASLAPAPKMGAA